MQRGRPNPTATACDVSGHRNGSDPRFVGSGHSSFAGSCVLWLVVAGEVDGELAQDLAGDGVDDPHVEVVDQEQDVGSGVGSSDADVAE